MVVGRQHLAVMGMRMRMWVRMGSMGGVMSSCHRSSGCIGHCARSVAIGSWRQLLLLLAVTVLTVTVGMDVTVTMAVTVTVTVTVRVTVTGARGVAIAAAPSTVGILDVKLW